MTWNWLFIPYILNILILVPVCYQMVWGQGVSTVFECKIEDSEGLRLLIASLWSAILVASVAGLFFPIFFMPFIFAQIFYKAMWLMIYSLPTWRTGGFEAIPSGISWSFVAICVLYPIFVILYFLTNGS